MIREFNTRLISEAAGHRAQLLFVFKGGLVTAGTLRALREKGCVTIQFYPDTSIWGHGPYLPDSIKEYDWVFTTKSFGVADLQRSLGVSRSSYLPHAYDPEVHRPIALEDDENEFFSSDVSLVGSWSGKKQTLIEEIMHSRPAVRLSVWGPPGWRRLPEVYRGQSVFGLEYAKAICATKINLAPLIEKQRGASSGDLTTARTFEIPAAGGFMLHERTHEAESYFASGKECAFYKDKGELLKNIDYYLDNDAERIEVAENGMKRVESSGHSVDNRIVEIVRKYREISGA